MNKGQVHLFNMIKSYLTIYLPRQKKVSDNTCKSYREALNLLLGFLCEYLEKPLGSLDLDDITAENVELFIQWLEDKITNLKMESQILLLNLII